MLNEETRNQDTSVLGAQALFLTKSLEHTLLDAERDSEAEHFSLNTVEGAALAMEEYRIQAEALHATAENAKLGAFLEPDADMGISQAQNYISRSTDKVNAAASSAHDTTLSEIEILQEVARIAEADVESCLEATTKILLSTEKILRSAEEAASLANQARSLAKQELRMFEAYRSDAEETFATVCEALQVISKEARLCAEEERGSQLYIQTSDDAFLATKASIEEDLCLLRERLLLGESDAAVTEKIAVQKENMLAAACNREEAAKEHMNYVSECSYGKVTHDQAAPVEGHTSGVTNMKNILAAEGNIVRAAQLAREASTQSSTALRRCVDVQTELRGAMESSDVAVETFEAAILALAAEVKDCEDAGVAVPACDFDTVAVLSRHTQRRLDATSQLDTFVEKTINANEHTQQLVQKIFAVCDSAFVAKKDGDTLVVRCGVAAAKVSALATQTHQTEARMTARAETALARAHDCAQKSRQASENAHAAAVEEAAALARDSYNRLHPLDMRQLSRSHSHHSASEDERVPNLVLNHGSPSLSPCVSVVSTRVSHVTYPQSAGLSNVSSSPVSDRKSTLSSPPHSARRPSLSSGSPSLSTRKDSEHPLPASQDALERVHELRNSVRAEAARAEEWALSAERVALALQHTVQRAEFATDTAREASHVTENEVASAHNCLGHLRSLHAKSCGAVDASTRQITACEEATRVLTKRITIADNVLQDEQASGEEEMYLLEARNAASTVVTQRSQLLCRVHAAVAKREQQALEHVAMARASTMVEEAQKHADRVAFYVSEAICLQSNATHSDHLTRAIRSSAQAAEQISAAAASAFEINHEVRVALDETHKACDVAFHAAMDLKVWKAECDKLGVDCAQGELQGANNMPWYTQRCREAARQVEEMTRHILMLQELTQDAAAQVAQQSQQIHNIRSEAELTVRRVMEASREAYAIAVRVRQLGIEMMALAEAALVRVRNEANSVRETATETANIGSATKGSISSQRKEPQEEQEAEMRASLTHKPLSTVSPYEVTMGSTDSEDNRDDAGKLVGVKNIVLEGGR